MPNGAARFAWDLTPASSRRTENVGLTPVTSNRLPAAAVRTLDAYAETVLTCPPRLARSGGVHLLSASGRGLPSWHGYTLPIVRLWRAVQRCVPNAFTLAGDFRAADAVTFAPSQTMHRAEHIAEEDPSALHLRTRFDGAIFGVRGPHGRLISWAALKLKTDHIWEIAVATEADYRGKGYARDAVSAAARFTLDQGRLPIYIHDRDNGTSAFVARAAGFQLYAEIVISEY
jgi:RimJ/RimL family protein N-acetyltransferase